MLTLSLDTSGLTLSLALSENGTIVAHQTYAERRGQSEALLPLLQQALDSAGKTQQEIERIAVVTGPGSFTGIRLGLAAAQGLARGLNCPLVGVDRFTLLRHITPDSPLVIVLESLRPELYVSLADGTAAMLTPTELLPHLPASCSLMGDAIDKIEGDYTRLSLPDGAIALAQALATGCPTTAPVPFYLRPPDVTFARSASL